MRNRPFSDDALRAMYPGGQGRPHIPVDRHAPEADFAAIASRYPVFQVISEPACAAELVQEGIFLSRRRGSRVLVRTRSRSDRPEGPGTYGPSYLRVSPGRE